VPVDLVPESPEWWLARLCAQLAERQGDIDVFTSYYEGDHPLPWLAPQARDEFRRILRMTRSNYMGLVVDAMVERCKVEGFRFAAGSLSESDGDAEDVDALDADTWRIWQANDMDAGFDSVLLESAINGTAYLSLAPNLADPKTPLIFAEHPSQVIVDYRPGSGRRQRAAGLKLWVDDWTGSTCATLQLPGGIFKYVAEKGVSGSLDWSRREVVGEQWGGRNEAGEVTLVEVPNNPRMLTGGRSEIYDVMDIQDRINKTIADRLITQDYGAFPQRWIAGWPAEDEAGNLVAPIDIGRNRFVTTNTSKTDTDFGQWDAAPLDPYSAAKREDVKDIASRTRTPAQYLLGEMNNVSGDALALDTPIPTPSGLRQIGEIVSGDLVFDEHGQVQVVEHAHPVLYGRTCYRVTLDDDATFIADGGHRWAVTSIPERRGAAPRTIWQRTERTVRTTEYLADHLLAANGQKAHAIEMAEGHDGPEIDFPVDPYVLGVYLGDGCRHNGSIASGDDDVIEMAELLRACGETTTSRRVRTVNLITCHKGPDRPALRGRLNGLGILFKKAIPEAYFQGSFKQRLSLLQGIMDTDGYASKSSRGNVTLELHDEGLARDVHRLACSLGHKVSVRPNKYVKLGTPVVPKGGTYTRWRMTWFPADIVFRMERKVSVQTDRPVDRPKTVRRVIKSIQRVESVPVRCLTVTGPSHLYLAGVEHVPTHNTLQASQSGLVAKCQSRMRPWGEGAEDAIRVARRLAGLPDAGAQGMETIWHNPEFRTVGELTDAIIKKLQTGMIDTRQAREDAGYSASQIARMESRQAVAAQEAIDMRNQSMLSAIQDFGSQPLTNG
jgi:hypothetical protein